MEGQEYFKNALKDFTFDTACGGEIRHLVDLGYTVAQIMEQLSFPVSYGRVQQAVWKYLTETGVVLLEEPGKGGRKEASVFVKEYDKYGKPSFRRVSGDAKGQKEIFWKERRFVGEKEEELELFLAEECKRNGEGFSYISCSFGVKWQEWEKMLQGLDGRQREYIQGLPWERNAVYHRLDRRMREIAVRLYGIRRHYGDGCYRIGDYEKNCCYRIGNYKKSSCYGIGDYEKSSCYGIGGYEKDSRYGLEGYRMDCYFMKTEEKVRI